MGQSLSNILLHIIFSTKNRQAFIDQNIEKNLYALIVSLSSSSGSYIHKIGGFEDHIHIFCTLPRTIAVSDLLELIKKTSSKWIKTQGLQYKNFAWQNGYGVFSISQSQHENLCKYIENQKEHHKKISFQEEYRKFLNLYKVIYDEKYVWD